MNISEAAQIAFDLMLQEDFASDLTRHLAWYACHLFWQNPAAPSEETAEQEEEADEEEEDVSSIQDSAQNSENLFSQSISFCYHIDS